jgi:[ribosomal protein S5]-alanine N-acetyltransferase
MYSSRLVFKRLSKHDFRSYSLLVKNEHVMKYITSKALNTKEAEKRFLKAIYSNTQNPEAGFFIVKNKSENCLIGVSKLVRMEINRAEVGYMLLPECWGKGYATEMVECMINLAKQQNIHELIGIVDPENPASIRVLTKFGFEHYETGQIDGLAAAYYKLKITDQEFPFL